MTKKIMIDGNSFTDLDGFIKEFNIKVFGDDRTWMGGFGALNDMLRGGYGTPEGPYTIEWLNAHKSKEDLGKESTLKWLEARKDRVHPANRERWAMRIELMKYNIGDTLFMDIVDIIVSHPNITLILN